MDEGYDESHNPFSDMNEKYVEKREQQIKQQKTERMSARRKQINEVCTDLYLVKNKNTIL